MTLNVHQSLVQTMAQRQAAVYNERVIIVAATKLVSSINRRIIRQGLKTDGTKIGKYSETPFYAGPKAFIVKSKNKKTGKTGKSKFKNGKSHKTMYLETGYKQLREVQGRESSFVNLEYTGSMMNDYKVGRDGNDIVVGFTNIEESKKRKANDERFDGPIFAASRDDMASYRQAIVLESKQLIKELSGG